MDLSKYDANAALSPPSAPASPSTGFATDGNPAGGVPATVPGAYWYHQLQAEMAAVLSEAGVTPDHEELTQLPSALRGLFGFRALAVITASTSWTVPDDVRRVGVLCVAGGGGGTYCNPNVPSASNYLSGACGGAGGAALGFYDVAPGDEISVTVGAGGAGGVYGGAAAASGGSSAFGSHCSATGGNPAVWTSANNSAGGVGGNATGGALNLYGGDGTDGQTSSNLFVGGVGGASVFGGGRRSANVVGTHTAALAPGSGGGGRYGTAGSGSAGAPGVVVLLY